MAEDGLAMDHCWRCPGCALPGTEAAVPSLKFANADIRRGFVRKVYPGTEPWL